MTIDAKSLYAERLGRYQSAMALLPTDRVPLATSIVGPALTYTGMNHQEVCYDPVRLLESCRAFYRDFP